MLAVQTAKITPNAARTKKFECVIDSGAGRCLFHADIGRFIGLDIKAGTPEVTNGIGGQETTWLHEVMLYIPGGAVKIRAGFKENLPVAGLLGAQGFFEHFVVTFDSKAQECVLERIYLA